MQKNIFYFKFLAPLLILKGTLNSSTHFFFLTVFPINHEKDFSLLSAFHIRNLFHCSSDITQRTTPKKGRNKEMSKKRKVETRLFLITNLKTFLFWISTMKEACTCMRIREERRKNHRNRKTLLHLNSVRGQEKKLCCDEVL